MNDPNEEELPAPPAPPPPAPPAPTVIETAPFPSRFAPVIGAAAMHSPPAPPPPHRSHRPHRQRRRRRQRNPSHSDVRGNIPCTARSEYLRFHDASSFHGEITIDTGVAALIQRHFRRPAAVQKLQRSIVNCSVCYKRILRSARHAHHCLGMLARTVSASIGVICISILLA